MILRDGYKMTVLGVLPVDWVVNSLKDTAKVVTGKTPATQTPMFWGGNIPWITPSDIDGQRDVFTSERMLSAEGFSNNPAKLPPNTILVTCIASIGKNAITRTISSCNQQINAILPNPKYISEFLYYWISNNKDYYVSNAAKTAVMILNKSTFENLPVVLPPLPEQQKIADILSTVDEHIVETESLIEKTKVLKQGMIMQLLTKGIGHTEFKDTEIGRIPAEWEVVDFGSLCFSRTVKYQPTTAEVIKYIALEHLDQGTGRLLSYGSSCDTTSIKTEFHKNDVLFGKLRPYLRKFWLAQFDGVCSTEILVLKSNEKALSSIILYFVEQDSFIEMATGKAYGTKMPRASWEDIKAIQVPQISLLEQQKIAAILTSLDDQINDYQTKLTSLTKLKSALMQQLLTGKKRVKI